MEKSLIIYCDGGSRGNPGPAASAFVVTHNGTVIYSQGNYLGKETNNVAEYTAVYLAVKWLSETKDKEIKNVLFNLDSQLVERQLNGFYKIKNPNLKKLFDEIKIIISKISFPVKFNWGYREKNKLADELVNQTLDRNMSSTGKQ